MVDRERYRKRNRNKMVYYRDIVGENWRQRKERQKGNIGNSLLSRISMNPDTNPVSYWIANADLFDIQHFMFPLYYSNEYQSFPNTEWFR